jgi:ligand-binding sensor protein
MVKTLYSSHSVFDNKCSNNSSLFGDLEQSRYGKNIIYECGFTLMHKQDQHLI